MHVTLVSSGPGGSHWCGWYTGLVETEVRERFERIEAILEAVAKRQDRFDKQLQAAAARQDRFDKQLQATAKLVAEGIKIVRTLARDTRELKRSQKAFLDSLRHGGNGRGPGRV